MSLERLLDRLLALVPLGVLAYVIKRAESERRELLHQLADDRESFRNERRELINRVQFPHLAPVATQPTRPADRTNGVSPSEQARAEWARVGTVALPDLDLPRDGDDAPGAGD